VRTPASWSDCSPAPEGASAGADLEAVAALLGRAPAAPFTVAVRCPHGRPAVIQNAPVDDAGRPFPTRNWLVCRALVAAVSRLESAGGVRMLEDDPDVREALAAAQARHAALHAGHAVAGAGDPRRAKCLHAHLAFALASDDETIARWILDRAGASWPAGCCLEPPPSNGQAAAAGDAERSPTKLAKRRRRLEEPGPARGAVRAS
jgi:uncharacterized protein